MTNNASVIFLRADVSKRGYATVWSLYVSPSVCLWRSGTVIT